MDRIYGDIDAATESATGLFYRKKETVGAFRVRFDDVSPRGSNPTYTAYGYASIDAPSGGYYGVGQLDAIHPDQARTNGVIALVRTRVRATGVYQYRVRLSDTLRDSNAQLFLAMRPENSTAAFTVASMAYDVTNGDYATVPSATDEFSITHNTTWEVRIATDAIIFTLLPTVTEDHVAQLVDDALLNSEIGGINRHVTDLIRCDRPQRLHDDGGPHRAGWFH